MNSIEEALNKRDMPGTIKMDLKYQKYFWFLMVIKLIISIKLFSFVYTKRLASKYLTDTRKELIELNNFIQSIKLIIMNLKCLRSDNLVCFFCFFYFINIWI